MAVATVTITPNNFPDGKDMTFNHYHLYGTVVVNPGTYPSGGIPISWNIDGSFAPGTVSWVEFMSVGSPPGVYDYVWGKVGNVFRILQQSVSASTGTAPFSEFPSGVQIPTPILTDTIQFHAIFRRS